MKSLFMTRRDMPFEGCMLPAGSIIEVEMGEYGYTGSFRFGPKPGDIIHYSDITSSLFMFNDYVEEMKEAAKSNRPELALAVVNKMLGRIRYHCPEILEHPPTEEKFEPPFVSDTEARLNEVE